MKINRQIELPCAQLPRQSQIVAPARQAARPLDEDQVIQCGVVTHHRFSGRFDKIGNAGVGESPPQGADRRRGEDHVANQAQADQQYA